MNTTENNKEARILELIKKTKERFFNVLDEKAEYAYQWGANDFSIVSGGGKNPYKPKSKSYSNETMEDLDKIIEKEVKDFLSKNDSEYNLEEYASTISGKLQNRFSENIELIGFDNYTQLSLDVSDFISRFMNDNPKGLYNRVKEWPK